MSPLYEYKCEVGHVSEELRKYLARNRAAVCHDCGQRATRVPSAHHQAVDGIYSYSPNIGSPARFERHEQAISDGKRVVDGRKD